MDKVKTVTDDDQWQLVGEFGFLSIKHRGGKYATVSVRLHNLPHLHTSHKTSTNLNPTGLKMKFKASFSGSRANSS